MPILRQLARAFVLDRLLRRRNPPSRYARYSGYRTYRPYRQPPPRYGSSGRGRVGLFGPLPYYSRTTRGGTRVSVSGCCLPIPLSMLVGAVAAVAGARRRSGQRSG